MDVNPTPLLDQYVLTKVESGRYADPSEVVRDALRRMQDEEIRQLAAINDFFPDELSAVQQAVNSSILEIEAGGGQEYNGNSGLRDFFRELRAEAHHELFAAGRNAKNPK
jgi:putative addiction module CopG family antidote